MATSTTDTQKDQFVEWLARIAASRDRAAFAQLFDHFAPRLKSFLIRKGSTAEQAEDLVQETMIAVWSKAALFASGKGSVSTWIFTIARNLRIDRLRRERSQLYTDLEDFDAPDETAGAEETLGRSQEDNHVSQALAQIPAEQRELLILSFVEDVPQSEIATRLGLPLGTVKSRMRLGYQRLRKLLEQMN
ncbi:MAG: sigma-70 family RNA polymerase sigma factor [Alphaproteobacteria bacterium]|nr:sigma-70 family RNA polymerase sigma factor [Alphaproteobacteria bacterium]